MGDREEKEELESYTLQATALVKQYVPPNPEQMETDFQAGNASLGQAGSTLFSPGAKLCETWGFPCVHIKHLHE